MSKCPECGENHDHEWKPQYAEMLMLESAFDKAAEIPPEELVTEVVTKFSEFVANTNTGTALMVGRQHQMGINDLLGFYGGGMFRYGFAVGQATKDYYNEKRPIEQVPIISQEEADRLWDEKEHEEEKEEEGVAVSETVIKELRALGIVPENFDGEVVVMKTPIGPVFSVREPDEKNPPEGGHGMYL